ncbi:hypothetical protein [Shewanella putrefaciens]|uniref:Uncharacterized protein n=1 Tax=Shewanella putrefaciens (strain CN-32 / ATCC BAA-453) TaxID=319224 RepID=A4Y6H8_SHEPC|nr:hypothetical protein [Shewanella putrefaciens]QGS50007.1 hypothetical protein FOB89_14385 [Shewanella putrefaciens]
MTGFYEFFSLPDRVEVVCPLCDGCATFTYAHVLQIEKKDAHLFENEQFEIKLFNQRFAHKWPCVLFFPPLFGAVSWREKFPEKYQGASTWEHRANSAFTDGTDLGLICCHQCMAKQKHQLEWPQDAFYSIEFKGHLLWAFNKMMMQQIRDYIQAKDRDAVFASEPIVIRHLPTVFKLAKNREGLVKKINKLIYRP